MMRLGGIVREAHCGRSSVRLRLGTGSLWEAICGVVTLFVGGTIQKAI